MCLLILAFQPSLAPSCTSNQARLGHRSTSPGRFSAEAQGLMFGRSLVHTWTQTCLSTFAHEGFATHPLLLPDSLLHRLFSSCLSFAHPSPVFPLCLFPSQLYGPVADPSPILPCSTGRHSSLFSTLNPTGPGAEHCWVLSTLQLHGLPASHGACNQLACPCHPGHSHSR